MKGFYHIWAWQPSWSCDLDFLYTHWFPLPINASYKIWLWLAKRFQRRRSLKLWTDDGRTTTDGRTPDHGHPISSPCEPNGSGELKMDSPVYPNLSIYKSGRDYLVHLTHLFLLQICLNLCTRKPTIWVSNQVRHKLVQRSRLEAQNFGFKMRNCRYCVAKKDTDLLCRRLCFRICMLFSYAVAHFRNRVSNTSGHFI